MQNSIGNNKITGQNSLSKSTLDRFEGQLGSSGKAKTLQATIGDIKDTILNNRNPNPKILLCDDDVLINNPGGGGGLVLNG